MPEPFEQTPHLANSSRPGDSFGRYRIVRQIALGGMAQILLAVDEKNRRQVVLKRMLPQYEHNQEFVKYFIHEGRLGQRLRHVNLIETIETGRADNCHFIALEYLKGQTAIELLHQSARVKTLIPLGVAVRLVADAARGLHYAHIAKDGEEKPLGVIHRDVTPHNLFVCADGITKVLDFGIAKASSQLHETRAGTIKGKFAYLAPEQIQAAELDHRTDIFALGIVLHELITLRPLFRGPSEAATMQRVLQMAIPDVVDLRQDVPPGLSAIVQRALMRDRDRRIPTALALSELLDAVAVSEKISATHALVSSYVRRLFPAIDQELDSAAPLGIAAAYDTTEERAIKDQPDQTRYPFFFSTSAPKVVTVDGIDVAWHPPELKSNSNDGAVASESLRTQTAAPILAHNSTEVIIPRHRSRLPEEALRTFAPPHVRRPTPPNTIWAVSDRKAPWIIWGLIAIVLGGATWLWTTTHTETLQRLRSTAKEWIGWSRETLSETVSSGAAGVAQAVAKDATLRLDTEPDAEVLIDGKPGAKGADGLYRVAAGHHVLTVSAPTLAEGRVVEFDADERQHLERSIRAQTGFVRIESNKGIEIMIDQQIAGITPLGLLEVPEGAHSVGFRQNLRGAMVKRQFVVRAKKETRIRIPFVKSTVPSRGADH